jgi:hypothetical protein
MRNDGAAARSKQQAASSTKHHAPRTQAASTQAASTHAASTTPCHVRSRPAAWHNHPGTSTPPHIADPLHSSQRVSPSQVVGYLETLCQALHHVHCCGILHRDLKSSNIFVTRNDTTVKLGDFGLACGRGEIRTQPTRWDP